MAEDSLFARMAKKKAAEDAAKAGPVGPASAPVEDRPAINPPEAVLPPAETKTVEAEKPKAVKPPKAPKTVAAKPTDATAGSFTLLIDVATVKGSLVAASFDDVVVEAKKRILEQLNLADYRFAEFGQGPGILQQTVAQILDENAVKFEFLSADSRSPEFQACSTLLRARASNILLGT